MAELTAIATTKIRPEDKAVVLAVASLRRVTPAEVMRDAIVTGVRAELRRLADAAPPAAA